jgi:hypothetical protein
VAGGHANGRTEGVERVLDLLSPLLNKSIDFTLLFVFVFPPHHEIAAAGWSVDILKSLPLVGLSCFHT